MTEFDLQRYKAKLGQARSELGLSASTLSLDLDSVSFDVDKYELQLARARQDALDLAITFDPQKHPRDPKGQFRSILDRLRVGERAQLPGGVSVKAAAGMQGPNHVELFIVEGRGRRHAIGNPGLAADEALQRSSAPGTKDESASRKTRYKPEAYADLDVAARTDGMSPEDAEMIGTYVIDDAMHDPMADMDELAAEVENKIFTTGEPLTPQEWDVVLAGALRDYKDTVNPHIARWMREILDKFGDRGSRG